ncbi:hypothetical protein CSUI_006337 [Cystoisospora suis]|uniref:Uncharacterized protein n=1 Tax=Cystoisospora suis TaxID=483139 RepID=A0A2C6KH69_9APIC|nr:hypothetical protein CSUI_006337 [Cystoisospora suis]
MYSAAHVVVFFVQWGVRVEADVAQAGADAIQELRKMLQGQVPEGVLAEIIQLENEATNWARDRKDAARVEERRCISRPDAVAELRARSKVSSVLVEAVKRAAREVHPPRRASITVATKKPLDMKAIKLAVEAAAAAAKATAAAGIAESLGKSSQAGTAQELAKELREKADLAAAMAAHAGAACEDPHARQVMNVAASVTSHVAAVVSTTADRMRHELWTKLREANTGERYEEALAKVQALETALVESDLEEPTRQALEEQLKLEATKAAQLFKAQALTEMELANVPKEERDKRARELERKEKEAAEEALARVSQAQAQARASRRHRLKSFGNGKRGGRRGGAQH